MGVEDAINKAKQLLQDNMEANLANNAPTPNAYLVGNYVGREELLAELPAITLDARNTATEHIQEEWELLSQEIYVWAFIGEVNIENLHRYIMRYGDAMRKILRSVNNWGDGWHDIELRNTLYTGTFDAGHFLVQGCRLEILARQIEGM